MSGAFRAILRRPFWQRAIPVLAVVLGFNVVVQLDWFHEAFPFVHKGQLCFHRILCALVPRPITAKWVQTVEIDDELHRKLGEPTDRGFLAGLVENATKGHAAVIVLDFKLLAPLGDAAQLKEDPQEKEGKNALLIEAIQNAAKQDVPVVATCWLKETHPGQFERRANFYLDSQLPLPTPDGRCLHRACARIGNINIPVDERQIPLLTPTVAPDPCSESLALAAASAYEEAIDRRPRTRDKKIISEAITDKDFVFGSFIREAQFQTIPARSLAAGDERAMRMCRGRIVLIGGKWHLDLGEGEPADIYHTPVGLMTGMYLHANYIEALLDDRYQREVPLWLALAFDLVAGIALYVSFHRAYTRARKLVVLGVFVIPLLASYVVFANLNLYLDFILPLGACVVHLCAELSRDYMRLYRLQPLQATGGAAGSAT